MRPESELNELELLAKKLDKALLVLHQKAKMKDIAEALGVSPGFISQHRNPRKYTNVSSGSYESIFKVVDALALEKSKKVWNEASKAYEDLLKDIGFTNDTHHYDRRLHGLNGNWKGYSYNRLKSESYAKRNKDNPKEFLNIFKIKISDKGFVNCVTEKSELHGKVFSIGNKTLSIALQSSNRRIVMFGHISIKDNLVDITHINVSYIDTGDIHVKNGLAIIKKVDTDYEQITTPNNYPVNEIQDLPDHDKEYLIGTQHISPEYEV